MPEIASHWPGRVSVTRMPLYTVTPAHRIGAISSNATRSGNWPT